MNSHAPPGRKQSCMTFNITDAGREDKLEEAIDIEEWRGWIAVRALHMVFSRI